MATRHRSGDDERVEMAVKVRDSNVPRYRAAPLGSPLPSGGGPFKQRTSIFENPRLGEVAPPPVQAVLVPPPASVEPPKIRVMASAVLDPRPVPEPPNDGFLGQEDVSSDVKSDSDAPMNAMAGTILLIAIGVGLVIVFAD